MRSGPLCLCQDEDFVGAVCAAWQEQPADAAGGTAVHAGGHKEASKPSLPSMHTLRDGAHEAQDPSAT